jgi:hypothetical protein
MAPIQARTRQAASFLAIVAIDPAVDGFEAHLLRCALCVPSTAAVVVGV